jgi:putative endonuclease
MYGIFPRDGKIIDGYAPVAQWIEHLSSEQRAGGSNPSWRTMKSWYLYIVQCQDGSLYTGITTNPTKRIGEHNQGTGSKSIVPSKRPVKLVYLEKHENRSEASKRESYIKSLSRAEKLHLIEKT